MDAGPLDISALPPALLEAMFAAPELAAIELDRELVKQGGLRVFAELAWHTVEAEGSFRGGWHIDALAEHLEAVSKGEIRRLAIAVPPRHMKSLMVSVFWPAYDWIMRPDRRFLFSSYAQALAIRDAVKSRRVIQSPWFQARWGHLFKMTSDENAKERYSNDRHGYRIATSVGGRITGEGGDVVCVDDPHNVSEAESEQIREGTLRWWDEAMATRLNDAKTGAYVIIQQRVHERDLVGHILKKKGAEPYTMLCLPAEFEPDHPQRWFRDPRTEVGEMLWPEHMPREVNEERKAALGPYACTPYESPVLMGDLSMRPIGEVREGDEVVGFAKPALADGDDRAYRRYHLQRATVKAVHRYRAPVVRMTLDSGQVIRCTPDHKWWRKDRGPDRPSYLPAVVGTELCRVCPPEMSALTREQEREAEWLAGFFDGEGSVSNHRKSYEGRALDYRASASIVFYQGAGMNLPVCARLEQVLAALDFSYAVEQRRRREGWQPGRAYRLLGNDLPLYQRFVHLVRPTKWRERLISAAYGAKFIKSRERVVSIDPDGEEDVFALETTTGNYVVWGFASSNSAAQLQQRPAPREGGLFKRSWFSIVPAAPTDVSRQVIRAWDLAATEEKATKSDPDYTASVKLGFSASLMKFVILDVVRTREDPAAVRALIRQMAEIDGKAVRQVIPQDPGQAGKDQAKQIALLLAGWPVIVELQTGEKWTRAQGLAAQAAVGNVVLVKADWNATFLDELTGFPTGSHDDMVDAASSAFNRISGGTTGILDWMRERMLELNTSDKQLEASVKEKGMIGVHGQSTDQSLSAGQIAMMMNREA